MRSIILLPFVFDMRPVSVYAMLSVDVPYSTSAHN